MKKEQLPTGLKELVCQIETEQKLTPSLAQGLLTKIPLTADELMPWADFEHPADDSYGRKLVYHGDFFEIMVMSWRDGDVSAIHDHGNTQWGAVKLFGQAEHAVFNIDEKNRLQTCNRVLCEPGTILAVNHDLIHQMGNFGKPNYLTLHLYGAYEQKGKVTANSRLYELDENRIQISSGGMFFELPESEIHEYKPSPKPFFPTWIRHQVELLRRLIQKNPTDISKRKNRLVKELFQEETWQHLRDELSELGEKEPARMNSYAKTLSNELFATAKMQLKLANEEMYCVSEFKNELSDLLQENKKDSFLTHYLDWISNYIKVSFPVQPVS